MKNITRLYSTCYNTCKLDYILSPFMASLLTGSLFSISIKNSIKNDLSYIIHQNDEIIVRLKKLEEKNK